MPAIKKDMFYIWLADVITKVLTGLKLVKQTPLTSQAVSEPFH